MKELIFISHANPEDNYFATWLASKLNFLGYEVWVDVNSVNPGQYFNNDFEKAIRDHAVKFLAIVSKDYIRKASTNDTGVMNEILVARGIKDLDEFIIPIKLDDSNYKDFPTGIIGRSAISFCENWGVGLKELLKYLEDKKIPKKEVHPNVLKFWQEAQKMKIEPLLKEEKYYTNWFEISLPRHVYIYKPNILNSIDLYSIPYTFILESDRIISFCEEEVLKNYIQIETSASLETATLFQTDPLLVDPEFQLNDPNRKLVKLLNKTFTGFLFKNGLKCYQQANKKKIFHFPYSPYNQKMINLSQFQKGRRAIMGTTSDFTWYFSISHFASLSPLPCFKIFYHIVFSDNHGTYLEPAEQHELRRSLASNWFNRKWFETLLAMIFKISGYDKDGVLKIPISYDKFLEVNLLPIDLISEYGYHEP